MFKNFIITASSLGISCQAGSPEIKNVTVADNDFGVTIIEGSSPVFSNCIIWGNRDGDVFGSGVRHSCSEMLVEGVGNIAADPMFVRRGSWDDRSTPNDPNDDIYIDGDYHLKSAGWRWNESSLHGTNWYYDSVTSRCIDAGNPSDRLTDEPVCIELDPQNLWAVNKRVNMGAYGSTQWASMAPDGHSLLPDINNDGTVNGNDLFYLGLHWLETEQYPIADVSRDDFVDLNDFVCFSADWLKVTAWGNNLSLKEYWPFSDLARWSSQAGDPNNFSFCISDSFEFNDLKVWHFNNKYYLSGDTITEDEYCFYYDGDLYSTNDSNDLEGITAQPQLLQKRFPGVIVPHVPLEVPGYGLLYPVRGSLSKVLQNSEYTLDDFPMGENNDVIAFIDDYGLSTERIVLILARGFGPLLIGSDYTDELIIAEPFNY